MATVQSAVFVKGAVHPIQDAPFDLRKHIAFIGRSNVGKSTFLNTLTGQKSLARSSSKPGKTTEINFFLINNKVYFVDLPGYGYAKQPKDMREKIEYMIGEYLFHATMPISHIVMLVDSNIGPTPLDKSMVDEILQTFTPETLLIVANKIDKVPRNQRNAVMSRIQQTFPHIHVLPFSSKESGYTKELLQEIL